MPWCTISHTAIPYNERFAWQKSDIKTEKAHKTRLGPKSSFLREAKEMLRHCCITWTAYQISDTEYSDVTMYMVTLYANVYDYIIMPMLTYV